MKKIIPILLFILLSMNFVHAEEVSVYIDGEMAEFDVPAVIENNRTMVPMRGIFEALGAEISWDSETKTVTAFKDGNEVTVVIGLDKMTVNQNEVPLDTPAKIKNNRTLVPLRAVSEGLGAKVSWDDENFRVDIKSPSASTAVYDASELSETDAAKVTSEDIEKEFEMLSAESDRPAEELWYEACALVIRRIQENSEDTYLFPTNIPLGELYREMADSLGLGYKNNSGGL